MLDRRTRTIVLPPACTLDLGGIAKGMAVDAALDLLDRRGVEAALVSAGGDLAVLGLPPDGRTWPVLIGDDEEREIVPLSCGALATSGVARRSWLQGGIPRHHLLDPRTGDPVISDLREVTVAAGTCKLAEVAATVCVLLGSRLCREFIASNALAGRLTRRDGTRSAVGPWPAWVAGRMTNWNAITWDTARAGGFAAYVLLTTAVSAGLVLRNRWQTARWPRLITNELHGFLSLLALIFIAVHIVAVLVDPFTRFGLVEVLAPFASHYRPVWMGLGVVALYLLLAVWVSSQLRAHIGFRTWRTIHLLSYGVYGAATVHGLGTGSDTRTVWASALYAASVLVVGGLAGRRLLVPTSRGQRPRPVLAVVGSLAVRRRRDLERERPPSGTLGRTGGRRSGQPRSCFDWVERGSSCLVCGASLRARVNALRRGVRRTRNGHACRRERSCDSSNRRGTPRRYSRSP